MNPSIRRALVWTAVGFGLALLVLGRMTCAAGARAREADAKLEVALDSLRDVQAKNVADSTAHASALDSLGARSDTLEARADSLETELAGAELEEAAAVAWTDSLGADVDSAIAVLADRFPEETRELVDARAAELEARIAERRAASETQRILRRQLENMAELLAVRTLERDTTLAMLESERDRRRSAESALDDAIAARDAHAARARLFGIGGGVAAAAAAVVAVLAIF